MLARKASQQRQLCYPSAFIANFKRTQLIDLLLLILSLDKFLPAGLMK